MRFYCQTIKCILKHLLKTKYVFKLVGVYYRTESLSVSVCVSVHMHNCVYSVSGERSFKFFRSITVSFDTILLLTWNNWFRVELFLGFLLV